MPRKKNPLDEHGVKITTDGDAEPYNQYTVLTRKVYYRCTRGHQWSNESQIIPKLSFDIGGAGSIDDLCPHCLWLFLKKLLVDVGRVGEVRDDT